jgi:hypothetical protein
MARPTKPGELKPGLEIWTVYSNPSDYPGKVVARLWINDQPTEKVMIADRLQTIRSRLANRGYVRLARQPEDDAKIVETWL